MSEPLDPTVLETLHQAMDGTGVDLVGELIDLFLVDGPKSMKALRAHRLAGDADKVMREAHSIKGSVANLGARTLADLCRDVETAARATDLKQVDVQMPALEAEFARVLDALRAAR